MNEDLIMSTIAPEYARYARYTGYNSVTSTTINGNSIDYTKTTRPSKSNIVSNKYQNMNIFVNTKNLKVIAKVKGIFNTDGDLIKLDDFPGQIYNSFITGLFIIGDDEHILHTIGYNSRFSLNDSRNIATDIIDKKHIIIHQPELPCIVIISKKINRLKKILL